MSHLKTSPLTLIEILENYIDWNISRQIVWGIRIPAYFCESMEKWFVSPEPPDVCEICQGKDFKQDTDTFDTWFSSGQWPFASLGFPDKKDFKTFYPTDVMETAGEITDGLMQLIIKMRADARAKKDFSTSDLVRDDLAKLNIVLKDGKEGTGWEIKS